LLKNANYYRKKSPIPLGLNDFEVEKEGGRIIFFLLLTNGGGGRNVILILGVEGVSENMERIASFIDAIAYISMRLYPYLISSIKEKLPKARG
jgi:hypothetical protein